jgi:hypothetical protein
LERINAGPSQRARVIGAGEDLDGGLGDVDQTVVQVVDSCGQIADLLSQLCGLVVAPNRGGKRRVTFDAA